LTWFSGTSFRRYLANRSGDFGRALTTRIDEVRPPEFSGAAMSQKIPRKGEMAMPVINGLCVGESLVGDGNEVAHIDLIMGPRGSAAESAFAHALTNNKDGFTSLLAVVAPNLLCKPATVLFNKVTIKGAKQAVQMFGPAQHAVAKAVADSVAEGVIPQSEADDLFICVGVFIHWEAADDKKIQDFNYQATKEAIARAVKGEPKASEVVAKRNEVKHPFAA
jgi:5,6,7,8-tetrahydromethanopterin hydro-lyase